MIVEVNVYLFADERSMDKKSHYLQERLSRYLDGKSSLVEILWLERNLSYEILFEYAQDMNISLVYCVS
jgi:hypothetical protein